MKASLLFFLFLLLFLSGLESLQGVLRVDNIVLLLNCPDDLPVFDIFHRDKRISPFAEILFKACSGPVEC